MNEIVFGLALIFNGINLLYVTYRLENIIRENHILMACLISKLTLEKIDE